MRDYFELVFAIVEAAWKARLLTRIGNQYPCPANRQKATDARKRLNGLLDEYSGKGPTTTKAPQPGDVPQPGGESPPADPPAEGNV